MDQEVDQEEREWRWDESQQAVLDAWGRGARLSVLGAPGTGKTTLAKACAAKVYRAYPDARIAVLSPDRRSAGALRNELSMELGGLGEQVVVQSIAAFSYAIIAAFAQQAGRRAPELIAGPDQDAIVKTILEMAGEGLLPGLDEAAFERIGISLDTAQAPAFRAEMRDLITRAAELELSPIELAAVGREHDRPVWEFGSLLMGRYESALATEAAMQNVNPDRVDNARLITHAAALLRRQGREDSRGDAGSSSGASAKVVPALAWDFVIVDDVQNATLALRSLLRELIALGSAVVTFGNPDQGVQGFRGGIAQLPQLLARSSKSGGIEARRFVLAGAYRGNSALQAMAQQVAAAIHVAGASAHRRVQLAGGKLHSDQRSLPEAEQNSPAFEKDKAYALSFPNDSEELAFVAHQLKRKHLLDGVPYSQMAVITRSHEAHRALRGGLIRYGVPVASQPSLLPLRQQPAVAALLECVRLALPEPELVAANETVQPELTEVGAIRQRVMGVIGGPYLGVDPVELRRMERRLAAAAQLAGKDSIAADVWFSFANAPGDSVFAEEPALLPLIGALLAARKAVDAGQSASKVLWQIWKECGKAEQWRALALGSGMEADQANADLDAVMQLFRVVQRLEDQSGRSVSVEDLLAHLDAQDLPEDTVAASANLSSAVTLTTASMAVGRSWPHVIVMGVNEGVWPNTKLRGPISAVPELVSTVVGSALAGTQIEPTQLRSEVIDDELRMLLQAVTRASESLILTCVATSEIAPSRFIRWLTAGEHPVLELKHQEESVEVLGVTSLVAQLRRAMEYGEEQTQQAANDILNSLREAGVTEADESQWVDQYSVTGAPESADLQAVVISPSRVSAMLECPLRGFLESVGGADEGSQFHALRGTLVHRLAQEYPQGDEKKMLQELRRCWPNVASELGKVEAEREFGKTQAMVRALALYLQQAPQGAVVEVDARKDWENYRVRARLDRLEYDPANPSQVRVVDFKTSSSVPSTEQALSHPQLLLYQWLVNNGVISDSGSFKGSQLRSKGAQLVYLGKESKAGAVVREQPEAGDAAMETAQRMIQATGDLISGSDFLARPEASRCRSCRFAHLCPGLGVKGLFS